MFPLRLLDVGQPEACRSVAAIEGKDLLKAGCGIIELAFRDVQLGERKVGGDEGRVVRIGGDERGAGLLGVAMHHEEVAKELLSGGGFEGTARIFLDLLDGLNWLILCEISAPDGFERAKVAWV